MVGCHDEVYDNPAQQHVGYTPDQEVSNFGWKEKRRQRGKRGHACDRCKVTPVLSTSFYFTDGRN